MQEALQEIRGPAPSKAANPSPPAFFGGEGFLCLLNICVWQHCERGGALMVVGVLCAASVPPPPVGGGGGSLWGTYDEEANRREFLVVNSVSPSPLL